MAFYDASAVLLLSENGNATFFMKYPGWREKYDTALYNFRQLGYPHWLEKFLEEIPWLTRKSNVKKSSTAAESAGKNA